MDLLPILIVVVQVILCWYFGVGNVVKLRQPYLRRDYRLANAGTHIEEINIKDPIMDFMVKLEATNGATSNVENSIIDVLDSIQIVDGSDVLWALDSEEILANAFYHYKESQHLGINETGGAVQGTVFKIPLGIGRMHPEVAFDPTRFANPQLVIEWDIANIRAVGADAFADPPLLDLTIMADVIDEAPARPTGYLMTKQLTEFVTTVGEHRVELPVDYPYRTMYIRIFKDEKCPEAYLDKVEHSVNEQKYRPFDIYDDDWTDWLKEWYGLWHMNAIYYTAINATENRNPYLRGNIGASIMPDAGFTLLTLDSLANCLLNWTGANAAAAELHAAVTGNLPFGTWAWPYGDSDEPEEWLKFEYTDKSRLIVTGQTADATAQVFLTQHRTY